MPTPLTTSGGRFRLRDLIPIGPGRHPRPRPYLEMLQVAWENRDNLPYAWRILNHGVCDGCSLGPRGLRDDVIRGTHLCLTRLKLLRLNTMRRAREELFNDVSFLRTFSNEELHQVGRLPFPMVRVAGAPGFTRLSWEEAMGVAAKALKRTPG